jgi:hypothetical protein
LQPADGMSNDVWVTDRDPALRQLLAEVLPEAEAITPLELEQRIGARAAPDALVIDGTQLLELPPRQRRRVLALPRVLICTGLSLPSLPMSLISGPAVAVLAKPFCVEDLEVAVEWLRGRQADAPTAPVVAGGGPGTSAMSALLA